MKYPDVPQIDADAFVFEEDSKEQWDNLPFLNACRPWLAHHGYTLYSLTKDEWGNTQGTPSMPPPELSHISYPYSFFSWYAHRPVVPCGSFQPRITYAQDTLGRDVVIKIVEKGSQEFLVYEDLSESTKFPLPAPGVMRPVDLLISPHNFAFVVIPRWGDIPEYPKFESVRETLYYMASLIQGLAFLHSRRIVHRDISHSNVLINHFDRNDLYGGSPLDERGPASFAERISLRERGLARYCLFDFDISMIFSPDAPSVDCRLDSSLSNWGISFYHPPDTKQGEFDYDPFPFDVACLGNLLAEYYFIIPSVPLLAPLFDRMTTHVISRRFTALEAAKFCDYIIDNMSQEELDTSIPPKPKLTGERIIKDRWKSLPPEFIANWSTYRETPPTLSVRILRCLASHRLTSGLLRFIRRRFRI